MICQFAGEQLLEYDGRPWCIFHLPEEAKKGWSIGEESRFRSRLDQVVRSAARAKTPLDLTGCVFPVEFKLGEDEAYHLPLTLFIKCVFMEDVKIENVVFESDVFFDDAVFRGQALLGENTFRGDATFSGADLGPNVHLSGSRFYRNAYFQSTRFPSNFFGSHVEYGGRAWFHDAKFAGIAYFENCFVRGEFDFSAYTDSGDAVGVCDIRFEGTVFEDRAAFVNRNFSQPASFARCTFHVAPEFHGSALHQDTDFSGAIFLDRGNAKQRELHGIAPRAVNAERAYRTLRWAMEEARDLEQEMFFFSLEQAAVRRNRHVSLFVRLLSALYSFASDYGRSIHRPLLILAGVLSTAIGVEILLLRRTPHEITNAEEALRFALVNFFEPTSLLSAVDAPLLAGLVWFTASVVAAVLLFLAAVSVRRRFSLAH